VPGSADISDGTDDTDATNEAGVPGRAGIGGGSWPRYTPRALSARA